MQVAKLRSVRGYKQPRHRIGKPAVAAPNRLQRQFTFEQPDQAWVTDITYIRTYEGWLPGMSRRGSCGDNAVAESFFSSLKRERVKRQIYATREQTKSDMLDHIEGFYNRVRRHRDRKSTRLNSSHIQKSRMPSSA